MITEFCRGRRQRIPSTLRQRVAMSILSQDQHKEKQRSVASETGSSEGEET